MPDTQPLKIYFDRSRWECDTNCRRMRYWQYEYAGEGVRLPSFGWELGFGGAWHEGARILHATDNITEAVAAAKAYIQPYAETMAEWLKTEAGLLLEGLLRGWDRSTARNRLLQEYEVVDTEREMVYNQRFPFVFACRPDQILRHRKTKRLAYVEFKTTNSIKAEWFRQWKRAPQLLATTLAVKQVYGEDLDHVILQPLYKGWESKDRPQPRLESAFVYGWRNLLGPTPQWLPKRPTSWKGWERVRADEIGYPAWLGLIGQEAVDAAIPVTQPIYMEPRMVQNWWAQASQREAEIDATRTRLAPFEAALQLNDWTVEERQQLRDGRDAVLNRTFQQNFKMCEPTWGKGCQYLNACWLEHIGDNPLGQGYEVRQAHHETELAVRKENRDGGRSEEGV